MNKGTDTVQQIKDRLSIVDVVSGYIKLNRSGSSLSARCPFHSEKTPSFHVSQDRGTYHCFGCGVGGDIFTFVEAIEGIDFKGALKMLAEKAGVQVVYGGRDSQSTDDKDRLFELLETATLVYSGQLTDAAKKYLKDRGVSDATINEFRIGWAGSSWSALSDAMKKRGFKDKELIDSGLAKKNDRGTLTDKFRNRIMFPINDTAGRVIGFSGRIFGEDASPEAPKYLNSPETVLFHKSRILYGFDRAKLAMRKLQCAVLVEGQMDLILSHQSGWSNTLAVSGTAFTAEHAALIKRMTENLILALDADEAGIKAAGRAARAALIAGLNVKVAQLPKGLDPADLIVTQGPDVWKEHIKNAKDIITFLLDVLEDHAKNSDAFRRAVEHVVLPFLADVQSPIAREQYLREIANRLGVSTDAIVAALAKVPQQAAPVSVAQMPVMIQARAQHAYAILVWQESLAENKRRIDCGQMAANLAEAIGHEAFALLRALSHNEHERLRFSVERLFGADASPARDAATLVRLLLRERLALELTTVSRELRTAESRGEQAALEALLERSRLLTTRIAKLHESE